MTCMLQEDIKNGKAPSAYPQPRPFTSPINTPLTVWCVAFQMFPPRGNMHTRTCVSISWCTLLPSCGTAPWPLVETGLSSATRQPAPSWTPVLLPQVHRAGLDPCTGSALEASLSGGQAPRSGLLAPKGRCIYNGDLQNLPHTRLLPAPLVCRVFKVSFPAIPCLGLGQSDG